MAAATRNIQVSNDCMQFKKNVLWGFGKIFFIDNKNDFICAKITRNSIKNCTHMLNCVCDIVKKSGIWIGNENETDNECYWCYIILSFIYVHMFCLFVYLSTK